MRKFILIAIATLGFASVSASEEIETFCVCKTEDGKEYGIFDERKEDGQRFICLAVGMPQTIRLSKQTINWSCYWAPLRPDPSG